MFDKLNKIFIILEMANNHMGDVNWGITIIKEFKKIRDKYKDNFDFGFKLQLRDQTIIHPDYVNRMDIKHIKRFTETRLSDEDFITLRDAIIENGFKSICTPFDEPSVDKMDKIGFDIYKVASCSFADWSLLERIVKVEKPIIISTGGASLSDLDNVVSFFRHRKKDFCLLHCVTAYPTQNKDLQLNQIDFLKNRYKDLTIGFSTHENPEEVDSIKIAIGKGARVFEKHVGLKSEKYSLNNYSADPEQIEKWLANALKAKEMCGIENQRMEFTEEARRDVKVFMRGVFAKRKILKNEKIRKEDVFLAMPNFENQLMAKDLSKYAEYVAIDDINEKEPILFNRIKYTNLREEVFSIVKNVYKMLKENNIAIPEGVECSISAHYGLDKFYQFGLIMIDILNREYCKKLLVIFPGQNHPEHYHKLKEESFHVLAGDFIVKVDDREIKLGKGQLLTINREQKHSFRSEKGAIIEEISTTHYKEDSFYTDNTISQNVDRKIQLAIWFDMFEQ